MSSLSGPTEPFRSTPGMRGKSLVPLPAADSLRHRQSLPIASAKRAVLAEIASHSTVILVGETGSGKTTQLTQFLFEAGYAKDAAGIACTQPRRVAAISVAKRVAQEVGCWLGDTVGYSVRFDDCSSPRTRIKYMTDGMLLREAMSDPTGRLDQYSVIILDEAHERTLHTDVLFAIVKGIQQKRPNLKIIVMSATLEAEHFSKYFDGAKILYVAGRQFPVDILYVKDSVQDYVDGAVVATIQLHKEQPLPGDILVFLTGQEEIESVARLLISVSKHLPPTTPDLLVCPIYAALPSHQQMLVFDPAPEGTRKVVLATNIAETSITIPGIRYVVDPGLVKCRVHNPRSGTDCLIVEPISRAQARQRAGRAGRDAPGKCFRLYTEKTFYADLAESSLPEIARCSMASAVLTLKALGIDDIENFDFMDKPPVETLLAALEAIYSLGALDDSGKLTDLGRKMAQFPLEPALAKALIAAGTRSSSTAGAAGTAGTADPSTSSAIADMSMTDVDSVSLKQQQQQQQQQHQKRQVHLIGGLFRKQICTDEVITIVAMLSAENVFFIPNDKREQAEAARAPFIAPEGDHLTLLNVFKAYRQAKGDADWCRSHFVNARAMKLAEEVRKQLRGLCERLGMPLDTCGDHDRFSIRFALLAGFFSQTALLQPDGTYKTTVGSQAVSIHPSSVLFMQRPQPKCVLYNELVVTSKTYMRDVTIVDPDWLPEVAPHFFKKSA